MANISDIKKHLFIHFKNYNYRLFNTFIFTWESDFFAISKTGYSIEVEIKVSRSDFKADFKKSSGILNSNKTEFILKHDYIKSELISKPTKFYFACPEGMIKPEELNSKYGLIWVKDNNNYRVIRDAKFLHKGKILQSRHYILRLLNKFYYRNIALRRALETPEWNIIYGQKTLNFNYY